MWLLALLPLAYALGMFPSAVIVARSKGYDITREGSGNPGASNVVRVLGWKAGALVMVMDFAKGAIASGAGLALGGRGWAYALGVAAVLGHTFPLLRKGGKGVAAAGGMLVVLFPLIVLGVTVTWFVVSRLLHKASLASLVVTVAFPVAVWLGGYELPEIIAISTMAAFLVVRHASNIGRLLRNEELPLEGPNEQRGERKAG